MTILNKAIKISLIHVIVISFDGDQLIPKRSYVSDEWYNIFLFPKIVIPLISYALYKSYSYLSRCRRRTKQVDERIDEQKKVEQGAKNIKWYSGK